MAAAPVEHDEFPATSAQERLWFFHQLAPDNAVYNATLALRVRGPLDVRVLERAAGALAARHETLRTTFARVDGQLVQRVATRVDLDVATFDLSAEPDPVASAQAAAQAAAERRFDLERGPLFRLSVFTIGPGDHVVLAVMHHIVSDGWSMGILLRELAELYGAEEDGRAPVLPELPVQYGDFAAWQREWLDEQAMAELLDHWEARLAGAPAVLDLPLDHPRPPVLSYRGQNVYLDLPRDVADGVAALSAGHGTTLFQTLLAGFYALLHRYTGRADLVVGTPVTGRPQPEVEGVIGLFVNTLALRVAAGDDPSFAELLARTRETVVDAVAHQDLPFDRLVERLQPERDRSHTPVVQVMFALQTPPTDVTRLGRLVAEPFLLEPRTVPFDLLVEMVQTGDGLTMQVGYATDLFERATIDRLMRNYVVALRSAIGAPDAPLSRLAVLADDERRLVVETWNRTELDYPRQATVHGMVERHARSRPGTVAVRAPDGEITYGELDRRAAVLAARLRSRGAGPGTFVCVYALPGHAAVTAMLAVLKAGAAYVPIDPDMPPERVQLIVGETGAPVVLAHAELAGAIAPAAKVVLLDDVGGPGAGAAPSPIVGGDDPAYAIYTSGSTGRPKGVVVRHRNLLNLVHWHLDTFGVEPGTAMGQTAKLGFDASVWEVWTALCFGATLHVADRATRIQPAALRDWIAAAGLVQCQVATLLAERLIDMEWPPSTVLRNLACGGEKLLGRPRPGLPFEFHDMYGPTECTVISVCGRIEPRDAGDNGAPPIGRPIANTQVYILDGDLEPVPIGAVGEIWIGGDGVSLGYLRAPAATAAAFRPDPFRGGGQRIYRTGDLGRFLPDGRIEMRGRVDHQVKVRGFRVELGEIESVLERHPGVRDAAVVAAGDGRDRRLVAYVVATTPPLDTAALRDALRRAVPEYMVPAVFVPLDRLPVTAGGKVDRDALPAAPATAAEGQAAVAPRTTTEEHVAAIWAEVLGFSAFGVTDKFFDIGGNSLGIVDVHERLERDFPGALAVADLFEHTTVEAVAAAVDRARGTVAAATAGGIEL